MPASAPVYPFPHNLGSRDWTSDERDPWPALGETEGKRVYDTGAPPAALPLPVLVGSADCIRNGERFPSGPQILMNGFPQGCYGVDRPILFPDGQTLTVTDLDFQIAMADVETLYYSDPAAAVTLLQDYLGPAAVISTYQQKGLLLPGRIIARGPDYNLVIISGTANFQQLAVQAMYVGNGQTNFGTFSTNAQWMAAALDVQNSIIASGIGVNDPITLVGHSYGGATAALLAGMYGQATPGRNVQLLTYGMPKPGDDRLAAFLRVFPTVNIANDGDPVPSLPPTGEELTWLFGVVGAFLFNQYNPYVTPSGQWLLRANGQLEPGEATTIPYAVMYSLALLAVANVPFDPFTLHYMSAYAARLRLAL